MKIKIDHTKLKPNQEFHAINKNPGGVSSHGLSFGRLSGFNEAVTTAEDHFCPLVYDFFIEVSHPELVAALVKPGQAIIDSLTPEKAHLWHMASCVPSEAGELFDAVKKHIIYGKDLDRKNVVEELGDLEFYLEGIRAALGITRAETTEANIEKLSVRYSGLNYSDKKAQDRADKAEPPSPAALRTASASDGL